jgi:hypothetical protein
VVSVPAGGGRQAASMELSRDPMLEELKGEKVEAFSVKMLAGEDAVARTLAENLQIPQQYLASNTSRSPLWDTGACTRRRFFSSRRVSQ